jgi:hypothetical protein
LLPNARQFPRACCDLKNNKDALPGHSAFFLMRKILLTLLLLTSCASPSVLNPRFFDNKPKTSSWANALRALDPVDASTPANDITAVYLHADAEDLQIRVDLLDFQAPRQLSLDIQIGDESAPEAIPLDIHIPSESDSARIVLDPQLATVTLTVPLSDVPAHPRVDVSTPEDEITALPLDGPVSAGSAPLLLTFYDTFTARLPAEALRHWDGAHSGPRGERHGLKHLLDAVEENQIPVVLLDLKKPESLSALDAMGLLPRIQQLEHEGLLILPDQSDQEPLFGFPPSPFSWGGLARYPSKGVSRFTFISSSDSNHLYHPIFNKTTFIPIATETDSNQPTPDGPSLEVRRALLETALNADKKDLLVLGGSFPNSTWGSPDMIGPTLAYFASRPYIHVLDAEALRSFPTQLGKPDILPQSETPPDELTLQVQSALEYASSWVESPLSTASVQCQSTFPKCVLENDTYLAIFDSQGAQLTYLFAVERDGIPPHLHQLIGPAWQVAPGINLYPGAFADTDNASLTYEPIVDGNTLTFTSQDETRAKTFQLTDDGLKVDYQTQGPVKTQIPLLVDPDSRFTSGWAERYAQKNIPNGIVWGLDNGPMVRIQIENAALGPSKGALKTNAFNESLPLLNTPEDPDFEYPPGHFIPFPMAVAEIKMDGSSTIQIIVSP